MSATEYRIAVPDADLDDLRRRLRGTRWPEAETVQGWDQGVPREYARELVDYWASDYDWRRCEAQLNSWPQVLVEVEGHRIHCIHRRSSRSDARPLVLTHGWPSSMLEFRHLIDGLAEPDSPDVPAFHVVVPSLPGYGFSSKPSATGTTVERIAELWVALMSSLGYDSFLAHGGDWGSLVTTALGQRHGRHCEAIHLTMPLVEPDPETLSHPNAQERSAIAAAEFFQRWESGYMKLQATRPQTLGYALADSPVGQLCWIVEKCFYWTDCEREGRRHPEHALDRDDILDTVSLYWLTNSGASSARLYWESALSPNFDPVRAATGCSMFPKEVLRASERWVRKRFLKLEYWNELPRGGHFPALEVPELLLEEIRRWSSAIAES